MNLIRALLEAIANKKPLKEVYQEIPQSLERHLGMIREALRKSSNADFGEVDDEWDLYVECTLGAFPHTVIVTNYHERDKDGEPKRFLAELGMTADGEVTFNNVKEVEIKQFLKAKDEARQLQESLNDSRRLTRDFNEKFEGKVSLKEVKKDYETYYTASVDFAQIAEKRNANNRVYPKEVLQEAVEVAQTHISEISPLSMDSQHRTDEDGNSLTDLLQVVALINEIGYDEKTGVVSLKDIRFVENRVGKDIVELLKAGIGIQVSQRGYGTAKYVKAEDGVVEEHIQWLRIIGFDLVPPGEASVQEADLNFQGKNESADKDKAKPANNGTPTDNPAGNGGPVQRAQGGGILSGLPNKPEGDKTTEADARLDAFEKELEKRDAEIKRLQRKDDMEILGATVSRVIEKSLTSLDRFNKTQKEEIVKAVKIDSIYEQAVDFKSDSEVSKIVDPIITEEAGRIDRIIASDRLDNLGFDSSLTEGFVNKGEGITHTTILEEHLPGAEYRNKLIEEVSKQLDDDLENEAWVMEDDHPAMATLRETMDIFYQHNHEALLLEAGENISQPDIRTRSATIASVVIPVAWRRMTALDVMDLGTMDRRIIDIPIVERTPASNVSDNDVTTDFDLIDAGPGETLEILGATWKNFQMVSTRQAARTQIDSHAMATTKGTSIQPMVEMISGLALDIKNRMDRMFWWLHIASALAEGATEVGTFETLSQVDTSKVYESVNKGWIPYEFVKTYDDNLNPTSAKLVKTFPADGQSSPDTTLGKQGVEVQNSDGTAFLYGTDYTVRFPDGAVVAN